MSNRTWSVLSWNVRGINSDKKWDAVRDRVLNNNCDIVCLQETKKSSFDLMFIKKICPSSFDAFEFIPSVGASGGSIII
jgi:exonuclease III